ncbi:MAG: CDP-diacylglycerol--glycerol-3-phosphate 3-phosphatidyltransferase [Coriobacteriia bacterium]
MLNRLNWANRVTLARMVFIPVFLVILLGRMPTWGPWLAALVFTMLAATDAVDGYLARSRNEVTTFGKLIDPLADKLLVTAALVALVDLGKLPAWIAIVIVSRELIVSGLRMVAVAEGRVIAASSYGKVKTVLQICAIVGFIVKDSPLLETYAGATAAAAFTWLAWTVMAIALLATIASMLDYFYHARDIITGPWSEPETRA